MGDPAEKMGGREEGIAGEGGRRTEGKGRGKGRWEIGDLSLRLGPTRLTGIAERHRCHAGLHVEDLLHILNKGDNAFVAEADGMAFVCSGRRGHDTFVSSGRKKGFKADY